MSDSREPETRFDKYQVRGAYHWEECERGSLRYNPPLEARYRVLADRVPDGARVLDLGCGDGFLMGLVGTRFRSVTGLDYEHEGLQLARMMLSGREGTEFVQGSCHDLPFACRSFDVVMLADVIEHLARPDSCLAEVARTLRPGGRLVLTTPVWRPDRKWDERHVREFRPAELLELVRPHFRRVEVFYFWPMAFSRLYSTRVGGRALRVWARYFTNPFLRGGRSPDGFGQQLLVCEEPRNEHAA
ncbi:MAG: class I SAM-dependent methyltransferase [Planctomycetes bacterium]|nr:class I SAM-dependent methyltransferase [Planctomycetota bacterium]